MRAVFGVMVVASVTLGVPVQPAAADEKAASAKDSPAAERTRAKLLKAKVTVEFTKVSLREVMKEFAAQVDMQAERPVMWTYAAGVPAGQVVTYSCKNKPLETALDELFKPLGLGYVVLSQDDQFKDGWVQVTQGTERGFAVNAPATGEDPDEAKAAARLAAAKELIAKGKTDDAKLYLKFVVDKYPKSAAAAEAKTLLEKLAP